MKRNRIILIILVTLYISLSSCLVAVRDHDDYHHEWHHEWHHHDYDHDHDRF